MHPSSTRFHQVATEIMELHDRKQKDYGTNDDPFANVRATEAFGIPAWVGAVIRLSDKVQRLKSMYRNGQLANEPVEDSFRDIAVYALIGLCLWEEETGNEPGNFPFDPRVEEKFLPGGSLDDLRSFLFSE